jgi:hypothetical protein
MVVNRHTFSAALVAGAAASLTSIRGIGATLLRPRRATSSASDEEA